MDIWAISDLHFSFARPKPMDIFGEHWRDHDRRIADAWRASVAPGDVVCLPGDFSWAMRLSEVEQELAWLASLPGRKVLLRGNHDYWWASAAKMRRALPEGVYALQNDSLELDGVVFAGARGWVDPALNFRTLFPDAEPEQGSDPEEMPMHGIRGEEEDRRIYQRELERLEASLRTMPSDSSFRVALLHFPPTSPALEETPVTRLLERWRIDVAVFGHVHGRRSVPVSEPYGARNGVRYHVVSADLVGFRPVKVASRP